MISFERRRFPKDVILLVVRWYLAYPLSYRNIEEMMLERNLSIDHATINRWVIHYAPLLEEKFRKNHKRPVSDSWRMDETLIEIKGKWFALYRAVDKEGDTVDFMLSEKRDESAARAFFTNAIKLHGVPEKVTIDKSSSNKAGLNTINFQLVLFALLGYSLMQIHIRQIKYLNNIIEQDHRFIKRITNPMMGFKAFHSAKSTIAGIELWRMLKKRQHSKSKKKPVFEQFYALAA